MTFERDPGRPTCKRCGKRRVWVARSVSGIVLCRSCWPKWFA